MIYFLYDYDRDLIKIGHAYRMKDRLYQLRGYRGPDQMEMRALRTLGVLPGEHCYEYGLHRRFRRHCYPMKTAKRTSREWYYPCTEIFDFIKMHAFPWDGSNRQDGTWEFTYLDRREMPLLELMFFGPENLRSRDS